MKLPDGNAFNIGRRLTITLALLITLILGGNGLVILQFERVRFETDRLTGVSQQLIAVLRLQESLLSFHQRLNELAQSRDSNQLAAEAAPLRNALIEQTRQTRDTLGYLPSDFRVDPAFLTALDTIEITLPAQLQDITALATAGDWEVVRLRLDNELRRIEDTTSAHVKNIDRDLDEDLPRVVAGMKTVQRRILMVVPATAISTVLIAAFFGWAIARRILELRMEERVNERLRIARDIHDTLLQSFQGVLMKFDAVTYKLPDRPEARQMLESVIDEARLAVTEGRDAVQGLRTSTVISNDLARAIRALGEALAGGPAVTNAPAFHVHVEGPPADLFPLVRDEVYRIAGEAVRNAFKHADANTITVQIRYGNQQFRLRVADDGKGFEPAMLNGIPGHYGLPGMQERARLIGGKLTIASQINSGTEIELTVPGSIAFGKSSQTRRVSH